jgi:GTPase SAR1 family protein
MALPAVLLVGNHSSGKSSFINHVLGRQIQKAGVAPTDDAFTIIAPGPEDRDQDGPALYVFCEQVENLCFRCIRLCGFSSSSLISVFFSFFEYRIGDPDWGFSPLRQFGPTLIHHSLLKIRRDLNANFIMIDTPGMIDSPGNATGFLGKTPMDRGYDFQGVLRWMAERADVVCLFFDPDKPGTTGETLSVLLHSLSGMDHKLLIVLNKADQFEKMHDFARAYGSLCWNLSKVIPRKDLPRIYTMCLPSTISNDDLTPVSVLQQDLETARHEVVEQIRQAPARRVDNVITLLYDSCCLLEMQAKLLQDWHARKSKLFWKAVQQVTGVLTVGSAATALWHTTAAATVSSAAAVTSGMAATVLLSTSGLLWYHSTALQAWTEQSQSATELSAAFSRTHAREIQNGDEYTAAVWQRLRHTLPTALSQSPSKPSTKDIQYLQSILREQIPALRRQVSPQHYGKSSNANDDDKNE